MVSKQRTTSERRAIVEFAREFGVAAAMRKYKVCFKTVQRWRLKTGDVTRKIVPPAIRAEAVCYSLQHGVAATAAKFGAPPIWSTNGDARLASRARMGGSDDVAAA